MFELWDTVQAVLAEAGRTDLPLVANVDYGTRSRQRTARGCNARVDPVNRVQSTWFDAGVR